MKGTFQIILTVDPAPLTLAPTADIGTVGVPLPAGSALPFAGGVPPIAITNVVGTVPPGVSVMPDGTLSGTPNTPGSFTLSIDAQDSLG